MVFSVSGKVHAKSAFRKCCRVLFWVNRWGYKHNPTRSNEKRSSVITRIQGIATRPTTSVGVRSKVPFVWKSRHTEQDTLPTHFSSVQNGFLKGGYNKIHTLTLWFKIRVHRSVKCYFRLKEFPPKKGFLCTGKILVSTKWTNWRFYIERGSQTLSEHHGFQNGLPKVVNILVTILHNTEIIGRFALSHCSCHHGPTTERVR